MYIIPLMSSPPDPTTQRTRPSIHPSVPVFPPMLHRCAIYSLQDVLAGKINRARDRREAGFTWYEWYAYYDSWCSEIEADTAVAAEDNMSSSSDEWWMDVPLGTKRCTPPFARDEESFRSDYSDPASLMLPPTLPPSLFGQPVFPTFDYAHGPHCRTLTFEE